MGNIHNLNLNEDNIFTHDFAVATWELMGWKVNPFSEPVPMTADNMRILADILENDERGNFIYLMMAKSLRLSALSSAI